MVGKSMVEAITLAKPTDRDLKQTAELEEVRQIKESTWHCRSRRSEDVKI